MTTALGLDIGTSTIKIVKISEKKQEFYLSALAECPNPLNQSSDILFSDPVRLAEAIKKCYKETKINENNTNTCLKDNQVFLQIIKMPVLSDKELHNAISYEAEQFVPVPLDSVELKYQVLHQPPKGSIIEKMEILVVAAQKNAIEQITKIVQEAGLKPVSIETEMIAATRVFEHYKQGSNLILSIGEVSSHIALVDRGKLKFVHHLSLSGSALTRAIANELSMEYHQAEQYKIAYGMNQDEMDGQIAGILTPLINIIVQNIQKTQTYINQAYPTSKPSRIILCGGTAGLKGLSTFLIKQLNLEILVADPFSNMIIDKKFDKVISSGSFRFVTAVGLALKGIV